MAGSRKLFTSYWIPTAVFFLGVVSIALLLWSEQLIQRQRADFLIADALMDVQMHLATFHLRLEEHMDGKATININEVWGELDKAVRIVEVILKGGEAEHSMLLNQLEDEALRARAESIRSSLLEFRQIAFERLMKKAGIGSAVEERFDSVFVTILNKTYELERLLEAENSPLVPNVPTRFRRTVGNGNGGVFLVPAPREPQNSRAALGQRGGPGRKSFPSPR